MVNQGATTAIWCTFDVLFQLKLWIRKVDEGL